MKRKLLSFAVMGALAASMAQATPTDPNMYMDINGVAKLNNAGTNTGYADGKTGLFDEFGFSQFLATSVYDLSDGSVLGSFYDTNKDSELSSLGIPTSGTAMDGTTPISLSKPTFGQIDIDALSPLTPPLPVDREGYFTDWQLLAEYRLDGTLSATGPDYTSGTIDFYIRDLVEDGVDAPISGADEKVLSLDVTGSNITGPNLDLFLKVTFAKNDFLYVETERGSGVFKDVADLLAAGETVRMALDTNVNPPIPEPSQLLALDTNGDGTPDVAVRQTTLDGSVVSVVPEPSLVGLIGMGMFGYSLIGLRRRKPGLEKS